MTGKNRPPSYSKAIRSCVLMAIPVGVFIDTALLCGAAWLAVGWVSDLEVVEDGQTLVHKEVAIDPGVLPEQPTERDWYRIAVQLLEDHGWDLSPNLTGLWELVPCQSYPEPDRISVDFADAYFDGVVHHLKWGSVSFDRNANTASVWIEHKALRWRHDTLDLSETSAGMREALEIADRYGGQEYQEDVNDKCRVSIFLSDHAWNITYRESGEPWSEQRILVDFRTGEAKRVGR